MSTAHVLSPPAVRNGVVQEPSAGDLARGQRAVADLMRYFETGKDRGSLKDVMLAQNDAEYFWARLAVNSDWSSGRVACYPDLGSPMVAMQTRDGASDIIGSFICSYTVEALPGQSVNLPSSTRVWGITSFSGLPGFTFDVQKQFMLAVSRNGSADVVAYSSDQVGERVLCRC